MSLLDEEKEILLRSQNIFFSIDLLIVLLTCSFFRWQRTTSAEIKCISVLAIRAVSESFCTFLLRLSTSERSSFSLTDCCSLGKSRSPTNDLIEKHCNGRQRCTRSTFIVVGQFDGRIQHEFQAKSPFCHSGEEGSFRRGSFRIARFPLSRKLRNLSVSVAFVWAIMKRMPTDSQKRWSIALNAEIQVGEDESDR